MKHGVFGRSLRAGYTLVETLIVIVILGVMAAMSLPPLARQIRHQRVNHVANVVAADLELAGALAAQKRQPVEMRVDPASPGYTLAVRTTSQTLLRRSLGSATDWQVPRFQASVPSVEFLPGGTASVPLSIVVGAPDYQRTVTMTRAGLVRVRP